MQQSLHQNGGQAMILGVDVSHWQEKIDWGVLQKNGVEFAFIKASQGDYYLDPSCKKHVQDAQKAGVVIGLYHWCDPAIKSDSQSVAFLKASKDLEFNFMALDVEQHWADWAEWKKGKITKILSPNLISNNVREMAIYLQGKLSKPVVIYSRKSFIEQYAKPALTWLNQYPLWLAYYPYKSTVVKTDWATLLSDYKPTISSPPLPKGCLKWHFWQFAGNKFILPGYSSVIDLNFFNGTSEEFKSWAGVKSPAKPENGSGSASNTTPEETPEEEQDPATDTSTISLEDRVTKLEQEARNHGWSV
jgi:lysozyme